MSIRNSTGEGEAWLRVHVRRSYDDQGLASVYVHSIGGRWHAVAEVTDMLAPDFSPWLALKEPEPAATTP